MIVDQRRAQGGLWCRADLPGSADRSVAYHAHAVRAREPDRAPPRQKRDTALCQEIRRVFEENFGVYGVRKVWRQLRREGVPIARCTVARLMRRMGLKGVVRGEGVTTTISDKAIPVRATG